MKDTMIRIVIVYLLLPLCWPVTLLAQHGDSVLNELRKRAEQNQDLSSYSSVCTYLSQIEQHPELLLLYADSIYRLSISNQDQEGLMAYNSFRAEACFMQGDYVSGFYYKKKALDLAEKKNSPSKVVEYAADLGYYYNVSAVYDSARYFFNRGIAIAKKKSELSDIYRVMLTNFASSYIYEGETDSALVYVHQAEKCSALGKDTTMWLENLNQLGTLYRRKKQMDLSIRNFELALNLSLKQNNYRLASFIYGNIATVYCDWNRPEDAIPFSQKALEYAQKYGTPQMVGLFYLNLGAIQCKVPKLLSQSVATIEKSLELLKQAGNMRRLCEAYNYLVNIHLQLDQSDKAENYLTLLDEISGVLKTDVELYRYYQAKAILLKVKGQYAAALEYYQKLTAMQKEGYRDSKDFECYLSMSQCYMKLRQYQQAYQCLDNAYSLRDSMFQKEHAEQLTNFSVKYKTQEKELEIAHLKEKNLNRKAELLKSRIWAGTVLALLSVAIFILLYMRQRQKVHLAKMSQAVSEKEQKFLAFQKDAEQRLAKKYIEGLESERERMAKELHDDVCNSLLAISMNIEEMVEGNQSKELHTQLLHLQNTRERLRIMSHELMPPAFQYATIDEMLRDYSLNIPESTHTQIRYQSTERSDWNLLPQDIVLEFYRIVQEAMSNALKYADASCINVNLEWNQSVLSVCVQDNGKGFDVSRLKKGIGLRTIHQRAEAIGALATCSSELGKGTRWDIQVCITNKHAKNGKESSSISGR